MIQQPPLWEKTESMSVNAIPRDCGLTARYATVPRVPRIADARRSFHALGAIRLRLCETAGIPEWTRVGNVRSHRPVRKDIVSQPINAVRGRLKPVVATGNR